MSGSIEVIRIWGDIAEPTEHRVCESLDVVIAKRISNLVISIDTKGGLVSSKDKIIECIVRAKEVGIHVEGLVLGDAMSAGFSILQACSIRRVYPNARLMFHTPRSQFNPGVPITRFPTSDYLICDDDIEHQIWLDDLASRTGQALEDIVEWNDTERQFTAEEALKYRLIDEIVVGPRIA